MFVSMKSLTKSKGQTFEKPKSGISSLNLIVFFIIYPLATMLPENELHFITFKTSSM